jgi:hypothetical protein
MMLKTIEMGVQLFGPMAILCLIVCAILHDSIAPRQLPPELHAL